MKCNRNTLAEIFGVDLTTIDAWRRRGCPFEKEGRNVTFDTAEVIQWRFCDRLKRAGFISIEGLL